MTPEDSQLVAQLCAARAGLGVDPDKAYLIESRLAPVARRDGFATVGDLLQALRGGVEERLIWAVVEAMTMGETSFFRDRAPFRIFRDEVLPALVRKRGETPVRIWSSACASGQEIYSLAMVVDEIQSAFPGRRIELFASDISSRALEKAQSGLYTQFEVQRGLPIQQLVRHFEQHDESWAISPRIRQMVRWRRINMVADLSALGRFDVIFCRYLVSSLVEPMRVRVLENLARTLEPDGFLFLGSDERADGLTPALQAETHLPGLHRRNPAFRAAA